jgi:hypothetical protein
MLSGKRNSQAKRGMDEMINSAAHAREILKISDPMTQGWDIADAQSYLAALEGPEVKALVEQFELQQLVKTNCFCLQEEGIHSGGCDKAMRALSEYYEAIKP